ncbi:uncharacterized protein LOC143025835 [Oratosquilla oratoria]|uniref:uncharacterized protein LOC143025835 n=1 Tax=Oratosquilla oratoria TaxID=337810 RepID=UPI003F75B307
MSTAGEVGPLRGNSTSQIRHRFSGVNGRNVWTRTGEAALLDLAHEGGTQADPSATPSVAPLPNTRRSSKNRSLSRPGTPITPRPGTPIVTPRSALVSRDTEADICHLSVTDAAGCVECEGTQSRKGSSRSVRRQDRFSDGGATGVKGQIWDIRGSARSVRDRIRGSAGSVRNLITTSARSVRDRTTGSSAVLTPAPPLPLPSRSRTSLQVDPDSVSQLCLPLDAIEEEEQDNSRTSTPKAKKTTLTSFRSPSTAHERNNEYYIREALNLDVPGSRLSTPIVKPAQNPGDITPRLIPDDLSFIDSPRGSLGNGEKCQCQPSLPRATSQISLAAYKSQHSRFCSCNSASATRNFVPNIYFIDVHANAHAVNNGLTGNAALSEDINPNGNISENKSGNNKTIITSGIPVISNNTHTTTGSGGNNYTSYEIKPDNIAETVANTYKGNPASNAQSTSSIFNGDPLFPSSNAATMQDAKIAYASSFDPAFPPDAMLDGRGDTFWVAGGLYPQHFVVSLSDVTSIDSVSLISYNIRYVKVERSVKPNPSDFEGLMETELPQDEGKLQNSLLSDKVVPAAHLRITIVAGHGHFCFVQKVTVSGSNGPRSQMANPSLPSNQDAPSATVSQHLSPPQSPLQRLPAKNRSPLHVQAMNMINTESGEEDEVTILKTGPTFIEDLQEDLSDVDEI